MYTYIHKYVCMCVCVITCISGKELFHSLEQNKH